MLRTLISGVLMLIVVTGYAQSAAPVRVKLATLAPDGSAWHRILEEMAAEWSERSEGRVKVIIYAGGVAGDDPDMVRKIRNRQLHASALTIGGLSEIEPAFNVFSIPLFFDSYEEFAYVRERLSPDLESRLEAKGFRLLHWGHGGWIHLFSKEPVRTVDDLKKVKMFTWAGDDSMARVWKANGFRPVPLAATDILTGLQTGMIEAIPTTPLAALSLQWFRHTPYMIEPGVAPLVAGTVISSEGWDRIPQQDRARLLEASRDAERRLAAEIPRKDLDAVTEMQKRGLEVIRVAEGADVERWRAVAESLAKEMRRGSIPQEVFDAALRHRDAFRAGAADRGSR